jgi:hypothetical protein
MKVIRERDVERYLAHRAQALGGEVRKVQWLGRRAAPDRVVMLPAPAPSRTVWVELKAPRRKPSYAQQREHERMRRAGQDVRVIDSFEGVDALFAELGS